MNGSRTDDFEPGRKEAAEWLARRDRGLTPAEQDDYLQWLRERPERAALMAEQEATLGRLMELAEWRPELSSDPDPDLFAPAPRLRRYWLPLGAAAAVVLGAGLLLRPRARPAPDAVPSHLVAIVPKVLPDRSQVELRTGGAVDDRRYSRTRRELTLVGGEAAFTVMKDSAHPFIVTAAGVAVRAVGTVFDVQVGSDSVAVLVSEGKVRVDRPAGAALYVSAGERAVVPLAAAAAPATLVRLDAAELADDLVWRSPCFQFYETPLADAVREFNHRNPRAQLALADARLGELRIGGTFRADDVARFVRILEPTMNLRGTPDGAGGFVIAAAP